MAVREASSDSPREKVMKTNDKNNKKVYLIAQEVNLAKVLAGNNKTSRDKALKSLKKWFEHRSKTLPFTDNDLQIIWKGLFYSMWMSDKPLVQEECAENIASLIHFKTFDESILFFKAGLTILINEWFGIDQLRLDKFLMLVRRLLRQMFVALKQHGLSKKNIDKFGEVLSFTILNNDIRTPLGLFMHFTEIYLEELAKITRGNIHTDRVVDFLRPFIKKLVATNDGRELEHIKKFIFTYLIRQSNLGMEYEAKYDAWKKEGFPGSIDSMQKIKLKNNKKIPSDGEETENKAKEKPLDPRAGRVDVELPHIKFKAKDVTNALTEFKFDKTGNSKSRKTLNELINQFTKLSKGVYPLGVKRVLDAKKDPYDTSIRKATNRLIKFENKLLGKDKKDRKRKLSENIEEIPEKRKKVDENHKNVHENVTQEETAEKKMKKKKKKAKKQQNVSGNVISNADDVPEDKPESKQSDKKVVKKSKKDAKKLQNEMNNVEIEESSIADENDVSAAELQRFIEQSEGSIGKKSKKSKIDTHIINENDEQTVESTKESKKKRKNQLNHDKGAKKKKEEIIDNIECVFERNSGTWVVFDTTNEPDAQKEGSISPEKSSTGVGESSGDFEVSDVKNSSAVEISPKSGLSPVRLFESPPNPKELFPKSPWDEPLQEGEYEICIPAKKHVEKLNKRMKKTNKSIHELVNNPMKKIKGKARFSLDSNVVKNPFSTPDSAKKVKINTKLNKSQEIHEHIMQILKSPSIPYDANKKPLKPLLKTSASSTPINPFYNKQLNVW